ncbi:MAG: HAD hydrolase-like protein [Clostridia bacterium]|nr:HAD hydrolase-like protein [Clostridia bacterium]
MKKFRYLLFDLDGTLTYSHKGIFACIRYALEKTGLPVPSDETLRHCIGPSLDWSFTNIFGLDWETSKRATAFYRERYSAVGWKENEPIEGALAALEALRKKGYTLALATSKPLVFASQISELFGFKRYLSVEVGSGLNGEFPTKAAVIEEAVRQLNANKADCLMIGDRKHDIEGAREAGVAVAALDIGYAQPEEFSAYPPDLYFSSFDELLKAL